MLIYAYWIYKDTTKPCCNAKAQHAKEETFIFVCTAGTNKGLGITSGWRSILFSEPLRHCRVLKYGCRPQEAFIRSSSLLHKLATDRCCTLLLLLCLSLSISSALSVHFAASSVSAVPSCLSLLVDYNRLTVVVSWRGGGAHSTVNLAGPRNPGPPSHLSPPSPAAWHLRSGTSLEKVSLLLCLNP